VWTGGTLFVASLALTVWWYAFVLGDQIPSPDWGALAFDVGLFTGFALHHSVFARESIKDAIARVTSERLVRPIYVWTSSLLLIMVCLLWRPVGGELYHATGRAALPFAAVQLFGFLFTAAAVRLIDPLELAGIRESPAGEALQIRGPYRLVRHPFYLGWMVMVFGAAHMTGDRLAFAAISSAYLVLAIPFEERALERRLGEAYRDYKELVSARVLPYVF